MADVTRMLVAGGVLFLFLGGLLCDTALYGTSCHTNFSMLGKPFVAYTRPFIGITSGCAKFYRLFALVDVPLFFHEYGWSKCFRFGAILVVP